MSIGLVLALVCIIVSIVFAVITNAATSPVWWALLAIFVVLFMGAKWPWNV